MTDKPAVADKESKLLQAGSEPALDQILNINDLQNVASQKLPKPFREYVNEGADDLITLGDNVKAYDKFKIRPRILVDVSELDSNSMPLGFSPTAAHKLAHPDGEIATSRAAAKSGMPMILSTYASTLLEDVAAQGMGNPYAFCLSMLLNRSQMAQTLKRVENAGFKAIFVTVDGAVLGQRLNEHRNQLKFPDDITFPNLVFQDGKPAQSQSGSSSGFKSLIGNRGARDRARDWDSLIPWLKSQTRLEIWLKGVYTPEDVKKAIEYGCDGVIISNHGGRQLDGVPATIDALRDCAPAAFAPSSEPGKPPKRLIQVAVDGGIRRGSDIFKALALGAQMCFVGRIPFWGLACGGEEGVTRAIQILTEEFQRTMALAGCRALEDITPDRLATISVDGRLCKL